MKKLIVLVITGMLMFNLAGTVLAADGDAALTEKKETRLQMQEEKRLEREQRQEEREAAKLARLNKFKEFNDELAHLSKLQRENLSLHIDINSAHEQLRSLLIAAIESGNQEALQAAREVRQELRSVNEEISALQAQLKEERQAFREALKNNLFPEAQSHIDNVLELKASINAKLGIKIDLLQQIITILS